MQKKKLVHLLVDECPVCGYQEFGCEVENPRNYSYWADEVTCRKCAPSNNGLHIRPLVGSAKKVKSKSKTSSAKKAGSPSGG